MLILHKIKFSTYLQKSIKTYNILRFYPLGANLPSSGELVRYFRVIDVLPMQHTVIPRAQALVPYNANVQRSLIQYHPKDISNLYNRFVYKDNIKLTSKNTTIDTNNVKKIITSAIQKALDYKNESDLKNPEAMFSFIQNKLITKDKISEDNLKHLLCNLEHLDILPLFKQDIIFSLRTYFKNDHPTIEIALKFLELWDKGNYEFKPLEICFMDKPDGEVSPKPDTEKILINKHNKSYEEKKNIWSQNPYQCSYNIDEDFLRKLTIIFYEKKLQELRAQSTELNAELNKLFYIDRDAYITKIKNNENLKKKYIEDKKNQQYISLLPEDFKSLYNVLKIFEIKKEKSLKKQQEKEKKELYKKETTDFQKKNLPENENIAKKKKEDYLKAKKENNHIKHE